MLWNDWSSVTRTKQYIELPKCFCSGRGLFCLFPWCSFLPPAKYQISKPRCKKIAPSFYWPAKFKTGLNVPTLTDKVNCSPYVKTHTRLLITSRTCNCCIIRNCLFLYEVKRSHLFYSLFKGRCRANRKPVV